MKRIVFYSGKEDTMKEKVTVTGVPETMIQTLYARAKESQKPDAKIKDTMAVEIVSELDYDFSNADKDKAMGSGVNGGRISGQPSSGGCCEYCLWSGHEMLPYERKIFTLV